MYKVILFFFLILLPATGWGSRDGVVVRRALASHQCGPGAILARCHMWVEFVVGSRLAPGFFSEYSVFFPISNSTWNEDRGPS